MEKKAKHLYFIFIFIYFFFLVSSSFQMMRFNKLNIS